MTAEIDQPQPHAENGSAEPKARLFSAEEVKEEGLYFVRHLREDDVNLKSWHPVWVRRGACSWQYRCWDKTASCDFHSGCLWIQFYGPIELPK